MSIAYEKVTLKLTYLFVFNIDSANILIFYALIFKNAF